MSLNKEQKTKAIGIITKSQSIMLSDKIQTDTQSDQNIYYSARPIWFGLLDSLRKEGIVDNDKNTTQVENIIVTNNAIPFELIERNELSPVSSGSLISLANEILENEANFLLYSPMSKAVTVIWRPAKQYCLDKFICKDVGEAIQDENIVNVYLTDDEVANRLLTSISWGYTKDLTRTKIINRYITDDFDSCLHLAELSNIIEGIHPEFSKTGDVKQNIERFLQRQTDTDPRRAARSAKYWVEKYTGSAPFTLSPNLAKQYGNELLTLVAQYDQEKQAETTNTQNNPNKLKRSTKWVDLATHNLYLGEQHFSDNRDRLMLVDLDNFITKNKRLEELKNIGFIPLAGTPRFEGGIYYLTSEDQRLKPSSLAAALGINRCPVIEMDIDDIPKMFKAKVFERFEINVNALSLSSELLGTNSDGHEVFNSPTGRFIRQSKFDVILEGTDAADNVGHTSFLRARSNQDLRLCAELFVKDIFNGGRKQWTDVTKFAQVIFPDGHADDRQLHQLQEAIEAASYRTFAARSVDVSDQDAFDLAKNVYYGLPVARMRTGESLSLQQYSTTLPLSVVAQRLVIGKDHTEGKSLIEPTAGNGGLLNRIGPNIKKYLMELDPNRIDALKEAFPDAIIAQGDATLIPFSQTFDLQKGVDYVITNPPFGRMDTPKSFDVLPNVRRLDHYIALQALKARKNNGRAVLILGADKNQSDGTLSGGSKNLMYYLNDFYQVEGAVELDGRLYARQGAAFNIRVVVVGQKRDQPIQAVIPEKLPVLTTYDELWDWSEGLITRYEADHHIPTLQQNNEAEPELPVPRLNVPQPQGQPKASAEPKAKAPAKSRAKRVTAHSDSANSPDSDTPITGEPAQISDSSLGHQVTTNEPPKTDSTDNFSLYSKCFPSSVDILNLSETLTLGGEGLQEAISANMAQDGSISRREHDYSKLTFETRYPSPENEQRNRDLMDKVADILSEMAYLSGDVNSIVKSINTDAKHEWESIPEALRSGNRMGASSMNFSSRLYNISRQFILGIKTEETATAALEALAAGMKPVVAVENTGESLLRQLIASKTGSDELSDELETLDEKGALTPDEALRRQLLVDSMASASKEILFEQSPQFRDLLEIVLDRLAKITIRGRYGDVTTQNAAEDPEYFEKQEDVREKIRNFPDLSLMPIDEFKHSLQSQGFRVAEVSGRKVSLIPVVINNQSMWRVSFHEKADAVSNVAGFQNGKYDAIVITRSGSTGISLHSSNRFADSDIRQRYFIVQQKAANISEFLQWMGRVNRKDQVIPPIIVNIESGLPAEARQTMMHNSKLRKLSANTTSNRENENLEGDEDLLNSVGDKIALEYLTENPDIADALDIALPKAGESPSSSASENPYINKLMGRLMMIPVNQQETVLKLLSERFIERIEQLEQEGINPFKVDVYDWKAEVVSEQDMQTGNLSASDSSFDEPVKIVEVNYQIVVQPMRFDELIRHIKRNNNALFKDDEGRLDIAGKMTKFKDALKMYQEQFVKDHLPAKAKKIQLSLTEISKLEDALGAKSALEKSEYLIKTMDFYKAGRHVEFTDADTSDIRVGVIAEIDFPRERSQLFLLSKYRMKIAFAGDEKLTEMSLASLRARNTSLDNYARADIDPDKTLEQYYYQQRKEIEATELEFNNAPTGLLTKQKFLLEGNIYRACEIAAEQQMGYPVLYTDVDGNRKRAVLMKEHITPDHLNALPLSMNANDTFSYINEFIKEDHPDRSEHIKNNALQLFDSPSKSLEDGKGVKLIWRPSRNCFDLSICGIKSQNNNLISNSLIFDVGEKTPHDSLAIKISGNRVCMKGVVKVEDLEKLLTRLENGKHIGKFYIPSPKLEIINELKQKNKNIMESVLKKTDHYDMVM